MADKHEALGLPKGSVRALIALSLIVIFAMLAVYMQGQIREIPYKLENNTTIILKPTEAQQNFALQTLTTVSTLVVALAAFYFGTKSVETARGEKAEPEISKITPESPFEWNVDEQKVVYPIIVETKPKNQEVAGTLDENIGKLERKANVFKFIPQNIDSLKNGGTVRITFYPAKYPNNTRDFEVKIIKKPKLIKVNPSGPVILDKKGPATFTVTTEPENEEVKGKTSDDSKGKLQKEGNKPNEFTYTPSDEFADSDSVTLTFSLAKDQDETRDVEVRKKK